MKTFKFIGKVYNIMKFRKLISKKRWSDKIIPDYDYCESQEQFDSLLIKKLRWFSENDLLPYDFVQLYHKGLFLVTQENKDGLIDKSGKIIIPLIYDEITFFLSENLIIAQKNGKWGQIDINGNEVIPFIYENISIFKEGYAKAVKDDQWGLIDIYNKEIIPFMYDGIFIESKHDLIQVSKNGCYGCIDWNNNLIIPIEYHYISKFEYGTATATTNKGERVYINEKGKVRFKK